MGGVLGMTLKLDMMQTTALAVVILLFWFLDKIQNNNS